MNRCYKVGAVEAIRQPLKNGRREGASQNDGARIKPGEGRIAYSLQLTGRPNQPGFNRRRLIWCSKVNVGNR